MTTNPLYHHRTQDNVSLKWTGSVTDSSTILGKWSQKIRD